MWLIVGTCTFLLILQRILFSKKINKKLYSVFAIGFLFILLIWMNFNYQVSQRNWDLNFIADIQTGLDIKNNYQWSSGEGSVPLPINSNGHEVVSSTYHRVAWATAGLGLIWQYPMGYGVIKNSFAGLLDASGIQHGSLGQTHSGWIDFGLAFGIPGLFILFLWMVMIVRQSVIALDGLNATAASIATIFIPLMLVAETAWKQYLEAEFFLLAFASGLVIMSNFGSNKRNLETVKAG